MKADERGLNVGQVSDLPLVEYQHRSWAGRKPVPRGLPHRLTSPWRLKRGWVYQFAIVILTLLPGCRSTPEADLAKYLRKGREFVAKKDYPRAILQFQNASKSMPKNAEPYYQLGMASLAMGDSGSGSEFLKRATALDPEHVEASIALSDLYARSTHPSAVEEGRRLAQRVLAIAPGNVRALNMIALADLRTGNAKGAASQLEDVLARFPNHSETSINLARVRLAANDRRGAEELLRNAAASAPGDATPLFALGDFYNITGDSSQAADYYTRGLQIQPDNAQPLAALGRLHVSAGRDRDAEAVFSRLAQNPDRRFRYAYAMHLLGSGRKDKAALEFARIFKENPEDRKARTHLIDAYLSSDRIPEAEEMLAKAIATDSRDVDALIQRARLHLILRKVDSAETDLHLVLQYRTDSAEAHYLMARVHRYRQNEQLQMRELSEALRLDPRSLAARIELSQSLIRKDPQRAISVIDSAPEDQREDSALRIQRVWPLLELKRFEEARAAIEALLGSGNSEVLLQDAVLRMNKKDFAAARASAEKVLIGDPADVRSLEIILRCAVGVRQPAQGMEAIRRHASQNRNLAAVQMFLGQVELRAGNIGHARSAFEAAKAAEPGELDADWSLIDLDIAERKFDDARRRIAGLTHGTSEPAATAKLALVEQTAGNYGAAVEHYRKVLQSKPFDAGILNSLAYILTEFLGNPAEALHYARTAKELAPENAAVDDTLGWTYYRLGLFADAVRQLELAVKRAPSARRNAHLAMAYARHGVGTLAKQTLRAALKMDPELPEASIAQKVVAEGASAPRN